MCENVNENDSIECKFYANESDLLSKITSEQKLHIFRIVQESITNALKHSKASEISVIVRQKEDENDKNTQGLLFMISDDGIGFTESQTSPTNPANSDAENTADTITNQSTHLGIKGMKSRASLLGAKLEIKSDRETGTQVRLFVKV